MQSIVKLTSLLAAASHAVDESFFTAIEAERSVIQAPDKTGSKAPAIVRVKRSHIRLASGATAATDMYLATAAKWPADKETALKAAIIGSAMETPSFQSFSGVLNQPMPPSGIQGLGAHLFSPALFQTLPEPERLIVQWIWDDPSSGAFVAIDERHLDVFGIAYGASPYPLQSKKGEAATRGLSSSVMLPLITPAGLFGLGLGVNSLLIGKLGAPAFAPSGTSLFYPDASADARAAVSALFLPTSGPVGQHAKAVYAAFLSSPAPWPSQAEPNPQLQPWERGYGCEGVARDDWPIIGPCMVRSWAARTVLARDASRRLKRKSWS